MSFSGNYVKKSDKIVGEVTYKHNDQIIGHCGFTLYKNGTLKFGRDSEEKVEVNKKFQGEGVGKELIQKTIELVRSYAKKEHWPIQRARASVAVFNTPAIKLFEGLGFRETDEDPLSSGKEYVLELK